MTDGSERRAADQQSSRRPATETTRGGSGSSLGAYTGLGLQFAVSIVLFVYLGSWADRKFGTSPLFLLLGLFVGAGGSFYAMVRRLNAANKQEEAAARAAREQRGQGPTNP